jgi:hypothetical protein
MRALASAGVHQCRSFSQFTFNALQRGALWHFRLPPDNTRAKRLARSAARDSEQAWPPLDATGGTLRIPGRQASQI